MHPVITRLLRPVTLDAQLIFNMLEDNWGLQTAAFPNTALSYSMNNTAYILHTTPTRLSTFKLLAHALEPERCLDKQRADAERIDGYELLGTATADGADDPVGIAFHGGKIAHAVTAWSDSAGGACDCRLR